MAKKGEGGEKGALICVTRDGPYIVTGSVPLKKETAAVTGKSQTPFMWKETGEFPEKEAYALCRCGASGSKPYCDGSHAGRGFNGKETAGREKYKDIAARIKGEGIDLTDAEEFCSISRFCHKVSSVWALTEDSGDLRNRKMAVEEACECPSGRLVAWDKKTGRPIEPEFRQSVSVTQDPGKGVSGPLWVKGGIPIRSADGFLYEKRNRVTLCRCGRSGNKPFCDGSHIDAKFKDGL